MPCGRLVQGGSYLTDTTEYGTGHQTCRGFPDHLCGAPPYAGPGTETSQLTVLVSQSKHVSAPSPPSKASGFSFPIRRSLPGPPLIESGSKPPARTSSPPSPKIWSLSSPAYT